MKIDGQVEEKDSICTFSEREVGKFTSYLSDLAAGQSVQTIHNTPFLRRRTGLRIGREGIRR